MRIGRGRRRIGRADSVSIDDIDMMDRGRGRATPVLRAARMATSRACVSPPISTGSEFVRPPKSSAADAEYRRARTSSPLCCSGEAVTPALRVPTCSLPQFHHDRSSPDGSEAWPASLPDGENARSDVAGEDVAAQSDQISELLRLYRLSVEPSLSLRLMSDDVGKGPIWREERGRPRGGDLGDVSWRREVAVRGRTGRMIRGRIWSSDTAEDPSDEVDCRRSCFCAGVAGLRPSWIVAS